MSAGTTSLLLQVQADTAGLERLKAELIALKASFGGLSTGIQGGLAGAGATGTADVARLRNELDKTNAAVATLTAANQALTAKIEQGAARRVSAEQKVRREQERLGAAMAQDIKKETREREVAAQRVVKEAERAERERVAAIKRANREVEADAARSAAAVVRAQAAQARQQATQVNRAAQAAQAAAHAAALKAEAAAARDAHSAMRGLAGGLGMLWTTYGSFLPLIAGFAVTAGIAKSIEMGKEFGYQMEFIGAVSDESAESLKVAAGQFMSLSESSAFSSTEIARGARTLAQAGFELKDTLTLMPELLRFSTVGEIDLARGAEIAAGQMHAFGLSVRDVPHILNSTAKAAAISQTTIEEMGNALRQASTVSQQFGVSVDETNAILAILAQRNIRGSAAGTAFMNMMRELDPHTEKGKRALKEVGVAITEADGSFRGIIPIMKDYAKAFDRYDDISKARLAQGLFNNRGAKAFLAALASGNEELEKMVALLETSDGYLEKAGGRIEQTFKVQALEALHAFENALIQAFTSGESRAAALMGTIKEVFQSEEFRGGLKSAADSAMELAEALRNPSNELKAIALGFAVAGTAAVAMMTATAAINGLAWAIGAVVTGLGLVGTAATAAGLAVTGAFAVPAAVVGGLVGLALFGGLGAGWVINEFLGVKQASQAFLDWWFDQTDRGDKNMPTAEALAAAKKAREERERDRRETTAAVAAMRAGERDSWNATGWVNKPLREDVATARKPKIHWNQDAAKDAWDEVMNLNRLYKEMESVEKSSFDTRLNELRAFHAAKLISDEEFNAREKAMVQQANTEGLARLNQYIADQERLMASVDDIKKNDIQTNIVNAQLERNKIILAQAAKASQDYVKQVGKETNAAYSAAEALDKKNREIESEISALYTLDPLQKDSTLLTADAAIKKAELAKATYEAVLATHASSEVMTAEAEAAMLGVAAMDKLISRLRAGQVQYKANLDARKAAENDWQVAAVNGLNHYVNSTMSAAKSIEDFFKKAFKGIEDAIVEFVMTGKLSVKDMFKSWLEDFVRMMVQMNITRPLAQGLMAMIGGGAAGGAAAGGAAGGAGGGGAGGYGSSLLSGASTLTGAGGWAATQGGAFYAGVTGSTFASNAAGTGYTAYTAGSAIAPYIGVLGIAAIAVAGAVIADAQFSRGWRINEPGGTDYRSNNPVNPLFMATQMDRTYRALGFNDRWAAILSGSSLATRMFGRRARQNDAFGIEGTVGSDGVQGNAWQDYSEQGGWFTDTLRGTDRTQPIPERLLEVLNVGMTGINGISSRLGDAVGVSSAVALRGHNTPFNIQLTNDGKPLTDEEFQERITEFFTSVMQEQAEIVFRAGGQTELADYVASLEGEDTGSRLEELIRKVDVWKHIMDTVGDAIPNLAENMRLVRSVSLEQLQDFGTAMDYAFFDVREFMEDQARSSTATLMSSWQEQGTAIRELTSTFDGSAESTARLAALTQERYQTEIQLLQFIAQAMADTQAMFANSIRDIRYGVLDDAGRYAFLDNEIGTMFTELETAEDPARVRELAESLNRDIMAAFNLLSPEDQRALQNDFIMRLQRVDDLVQARLGGAVDDIDDEHDTTLSDSITNAITTAFTDFIDKTNAAANTQLSAAKLQYMAATDPAPITVNVSGHREKSEVNGAGKR